MTTKRESNIGDSRGGKKQKVPKGNYIKVDPTFLTYQTNLLKGKEKKENRVNEEFRLFLVVYLKGIQEHKSIKEIHSDFEKVFKEKGFKLSRTKFFKLLGKVHFKDIKEQVTKTYEADKKRRMTNEQFDIAISSPTCKPTTLDEEVKRMKPILESHFKAKGDKIRKGVKEGSLKGGQKTKDNNFI